MAMTIKRAGSLAILAAGASSGVANAQIMTDTFGFVLDVTQPPGTATPQSYDVAIGTALGQVAPQYTFSNTLRAAVGPLPANTGASLQGDGTSSATGTKSPIQPQGSINYGSTPLDDYPLATQATPVQFLIGANSYTGNANFLFDGANETFTLTTVDYQLAAVAVTPEPAAWAMLIGGFGAAGGTLRATRRRKRRAALAA